MKIRTNKATKLFNDLVYRSSRMFGYVGAALIIMLMFFTVSDTLLRYLFNRPISGDYELTELALVVLVSTALAYTMVQGRHVTVKLLSFRGKAQIICQSLTYFISLVIFALLAWQSADYGNQLWQLGQHSGILSLSLAPFLYVVAFGSALLCLVILVQLLNLFIETEER